MESNWTELLLFPNYKKIPLKYYFSKPTQEYQKHYLRKKKSIGWVNDFQRGYETRHVELEICRLNLNDFKNPRSSKEDLTSGVNFE